MSIFSERQILTRLRRLERGDSVLRGGREVTSSGPRSRLLGSALTNGRLDPRSPGFLPVGSLSNVTFPSFTGTVTDTTITWAWSGMLQRSDGTRQAVAAASLTVTGLTPSTTYYFYPFFATKGCGIGFVGGNTGSPAFAHTAPTDDAVAAQALQDREPLSLGAMYATTLGAPGSTAVTAGGSSGNIVGGVRTGGCPRSYMVVESQRGIIRCEELVVGDKILSPVGWTEVAGLDLTACDSFVSIHTESGDEIEISPETPQPLFDGEDRPAILLTLSDRAMVRQPGGGSGYISALELVDAPGGMRAVISCEPEHIFWCGRHSPMIAAHNINKNLL